MQVLLLVIEFTLIYIGIILSLVLMSLIEITDVVRFIKKQFRELLTKELHTQLRCQTVGRCGLAGGTGACQHHRFGTQAV